jgi:DNA-directed RNA polymerase I subunit RPA2
MVPDKDRTAIERKVFPTEVRPFSTITHQLLSALPNILAQARERLTSYRGRMTIKLCWTDISGQQHDIMKDCGLVPVMVRVSRKPTLLSHH